MFLVDMVVSMEYKQWAREPSVAQLIKFFVVEPAHQDSSSQLYNGARIFLDLF